MEPRESEKSPRWRDGSGKLPRIVSWTAWGLVGLAMSAGLWAMADPPSALDLFPIKREGTHLIETLERFNGQTCSRFSESRRWWDGDDFGREAANEELWRRAA